MQSITVLAPDATDADAYATAVAVMARRARPRVHPVAARPRRRPHHPRRRAPRHPELAKISSTRPTSRRPPLPRPDSRADPRVSAARRSWERRIRCFPVVSHQRLRGSAAPERASAILDRFAHARPRCANSRRVRRLRSTARRWRPANWPILLAERPSTAALAGPLGSTNPRSPRSSPLAAGCGGASSLRPAGPQDITDPVLPASSSDITEPVPAASSDRRHRRHHGRAGAGGSGRRRADASAIGDRQGCPRHPLPDRPLARRGRHGRRLRGRALRHRAQRRPQDPALRPQPASRDGRRCSAPRRARPAAPARPQHRRDLRLRRAPDGRLFICMELLERQRPGARQRDQSASARPRSLAILRQLCKAPGRPRTRPASSTATSSPRTSSSSPTAGATASSRSSTSASAPCSARDAAPARSPARRTTWRPSRSAATRVRRPPRHVRRRLRRLTSCSSATRRSPSEALEEVLQAHVDHPPPPFRPGAGPTSSCRRQLEQVVLRCLAKQPDDRYADMAELEAALCEAQIAGGLRTAWDDLPLPDVRRPTGSRRSSARMPSPQAVPRAAGCGPSSPAPRSWPPASPSPSPPRTPTRRRASARASTRSPRRRWSPPATPFYVAPPLGQPDVPTAYTKVLELERLTGPCRRPADARATGAARSVRRPRVNLGDKYWAVAGARPFAVEYYIWARAFEPRPPAGNRAQRQDPRRLHLLPGEGPQRQLVARRAAGARPRRRPRRRRRRAPAAAHPRRLRGRLAAVDLPAPRPRRRPPRRRHRAARQAGRQAARPGARTTTRARASARARYLSPRTAPAAPPTSPRRRPTPSGRRRPRSSRTAIPPGPSSWPTTASPRSRPAGAATPRPCSTRPSLRQPQRPRPAWACPTSTSTPAPSRRPCSSPSSRSRAAPQSKSYHIKLGDACFVVLRYRDALDPLREGPRPRRRRRPGSHRQGQEAHSTHDHPRDSRHPGRPLRPHDGARRAPLFDPFVALRELVQNAHDSCVRRRPRGPAGVRAGDPRRLRSGRRHPRGQRHRRRPHARRDRPLPRHHRRRLHPQAARAARHRRPDRPVRPRLPLGLRHRHLRVAVTTTCPINRRTPPSSINRARGERFSIEAVDTRPVGTTVTLHLKDNFRELSDESALRARLLHYCALLPLPVFVGHDPRRRQRPAGPVARRRRPPGPRSRHSPRLRPPARAPLRPAVHHRPSPRRTAPTCAACCGSTTPPPTAPPTTATSTSTSAACCSTTTPANCCPRGPASSAARSSRPASRPPPRARTSSATPPTAPSRPRSPRPSVAGMKQVAEHEPEAWRRVLLRHNEALLGAALCDDRLFDLLADELTVPTSEGDLARRRRPAARPGQAVTPASARAAASRRSCSAPSASPSSSAPATAPCPSPAATPSAAAAPSSSSAPPPATSACSPRRPPGRPPGFPFEHAHKARSAPDRRPLRPRRAPARARARPRGRAQAPRRERRGRWPDRRRRPRPHAHVHRQDRRQRRRRPLRQPRQPRRIARLLEHRADVDAAHPGVKLLRALVAFVAGASEAAANEADGLHTALAEYGRAVCELLDTPRPAR